MFGSDDQPITKIWTMTLKSPYNSTTSPVFTALLEEILAFCRRASGSLHAAHQFWLQDSDQPSTLVLFTGYPSLESNLKADSAYVEQGFIQRMAEWAESRTLVLCHHSINELPLEENRLNLDLVWDSGNEREEGSRSSPKVIWNGTELVKGKEADGIVVYVFAGTGERLGTPTSERFDQFRLRKFM